MRTTLLLMSFTVLALVQGTSQAQEAKSASDSNSVMDERLRDAQVTTKQLSNGAEITEVQFAGSLQP